MIELLAMFGFLFLIGLGVAWVDHIDQTRARQRGGSSMAEIIAQADADDRRNKKVQS